MSEYIWLPASDGVGEIAVDLHKCRRFWVQAYDPHRFEKGLTYYMLQEERRDEVRWIESTVDEEIIEGPDGFHMGVITPYRFVDPREVAHGLLKHKRYKDQLPPQLQKFREFGDPAVFREWQEECWERDENHEGDQTGMEMAGLQKPKPRWDRETMEFSIDGILYRKIRRVKYNEQLIILDAFEKANWPTCIPDPYNNEDTLKRRANDFMKELRKSKGPGNNFQLLPGRRKVGWELRPTQAQVAENLNQ